MKHYAVLHKTWFQRNFWLNLHLDFSVPLHERIHLKSEVIHYLLQHFWQMAGRRFWIPRWTVSQVISFAKFLYHDCMQPFDLINPFSCFTGKNWWIRFLLADSLYVTYWHKACIFFSVSLFGRISWMSLEAVRSWNLLWAVVKPFLSCKTLTQPPDLIRSNRFAWITFYICQMF